MNLHLVDLSSAVVDAWRVAFADFQEVEIECGDLLSLASGSVVSPANSSGFMDGGIDAAYLEFFGPAIQDRVRDAIAARHDRQLPVGASIVVATGHERIPSIIVAPSMVMPEHIPASNCYRAFRAALRITDDPLVSNTVYCPGIGTGVGGVSPADAATEMANAFGDWLTSRTE